MLELVTLVKVDLQELCDATPATLLATSVVQRQPASLAETGSVEIAEIAAHVEIQETAPGEMPRERHPEASTLNSTSAVASRYLL